MQKFILSGSAAILLLSIFGCQTQQKTLSLEAAEKLAAKFEGGSFTPPPRSIADITALLEQHKEMPAEVAQALRDDRATANQPTPQGMTGLALASFLLERGWAASRVGLTNQALADLRQAERLSRDDRGETRALVLARLANTEMLGGREKEMFRFRRELLNLDLSYGRRIRHTALHAFLLALTGDLDAAEKTIVEAETLLERGHNKRSWNRSSDHWTAEVLDKRAAIERVKGRYAESERLHRLALRTINRSPRRSYRGRTTRFYARRHLARALLQQGHLLEAEIEIRHVLREALRHIGLYSPHTARFLRDFSVIMAEQGRFQEATQLANAALDIYRTIEVEDYSGQFNLTRLGYADLLVSQNRWAEALAVYGRVEEAFRRDQLAQARHLNININRVIALLKVGRASDAKPIVAEAARRARRTLGAKHYDTAEASGLYGAVLASLGEKEAALQRFRAAIPILITPSRASTDDSKMRASRALRLRVILDSYIELLVDLRGTILERRAGIDAVAEAFRVAEITRSRSVQAAVAASGVRAAAGDAALADLIRKEQDARKQIAALFGLLANVLSQSPDERKSKKIYDLRTRIARLRTARGRLEKETRERFPKYADFANPRPATIARSARNLRDGEALIATYVAEKRTYVWAVPKSGKVAFATVPLGKAQVSAIVRDLRRALDPQATTLGEIPDFDVRLSHKLYKALLDPVAAGWQEAKSLLVVPHGALGQLPFSVLVTKEAKLEKETGALFSNHRRIPWLVRSHAVTVLPSVTSLASLRALPPPNPKRRAFAGFGDPWFSAEQAVAAAQAKPRQTAALTSRGAIQVRGLPITLRAAPKTQALESARLATLPRLPDTGDEVRSIALAVNADLTRDVFTGEKATEEAVKTLNLSGYKVLAFATHGLVPGDLDGLRQPALALASPKLGKTKGDGLLTMGEILGLRLDADWVVLSACNTAAGEGAGAEAFSGLGRAFFYAGTRALLLSNWPVETTSARALTTDLFRRQARDSSLSRAQALRQAMFALIDGRGLVDGKGRTVFSYAHPIFWAPFSLVGDGGGKGHV